MARHLVERLDPRAAVVVLESCELLVLRA